MLKTGQNIIILNLKTGQIVMIMIEETGHCAVEYVDGEIPKAAKRKDNRVFWVE